MLFNSLEFALFFPLVTLLYFVLPHGFRWALLLAASCVFYMAYVPAYILILFTLILVDYFAGICISQNSGARRKGYLLLSVLANLSMLFFFKYYNFFGFNFTQLAQALHWNYSVQTLSIILPMGLSFHVFQSMSYTIEVYLGKQRVERHLGIYALYVMFYPQLMAGPIERPQNLLHQFYETHFFHRERVFSGLRLMAAGLFKKMIIADRLAVVVNEVYAAPAQYSGFYVLLATYFFSFQILCDFSGYTDIARGAARVMGFSLMENFDRPYNARTISEFWRRWHISLSTWFRDYLYIPLGGNRGSHARTYFNLLLVFTLSGLWHGANWTFLLWGVIHGAFLVFSLTTLELRKKCFAWLPWKKDSLLHSLISVFFIFHLVTLAWIFFRAASVQDAWLMLQKIFSGFDGNWWIVPSQVWRVDLGISLFLILGLWLIHLCFAKKSVYEWLDASAPPLRWVVYGIFGVIAITTFITNAPAPQMFIYFPF